MWLQIIYYMFCTVVLVLGLSWLTSSIIVFFRDLGQIISMIIQFGLIGGFKYSLKKKFEKNKMVGTTIGFGGIGLVIGYFLSQ